MLGGDSRAEQGEINRRDFLKAVSLGSVGVGVRVAQPMIEKVVRLTFDSNVLLNAEPLIDSDIEIVRGNLEKLGEMLGFEDKETWNQSVTQSLTAHKDMSSLCQDLKPGSKELTLATGDLHELSTTIWLLLTITKDFKGKGEELLSLVKSKQIAEYVFTNYGSRFTSEWMHDVITDHFYRPDDKTLVDDLFSTPDFLGAFASYFCEWFPSDEVRQARIEEYGKEGGSKISEIEGDISENDRARILRQLENLRLSKVARKLTFFKSENGFGSQGHGYVELGLSEKELNMLFSGEQEWQAFQLHEIGHIIWDLVKLIPNPKERAILRAQMYGLLESFSPTRTLNNYLNPQGNFKSISNGQPYLNNVLNEASVTQYPSGYFLSDLGHEGKQLLKTLQTNSVLADLLITNAQVAEGATDIQVIENKELSPLEKELVARGKQIIIDVERSERVGETVVLQGTSIVNDSRKLSEVGIPLALLDMIQNHRTEVMHLALLSKPRFTEGYINRLLDGYVLMTQESLESIAGEELFSELFQATLRRNNPEVENQMQGDRLEQFQQLINNMLDSLIKNNLARRESGHNAI